MISEGARARNVGGAVVAQMRPLSVGHTMSSPGLTRRPELTSTVSSLCSYLSVGALHLMANGTRRCQDHQGLWQKQNIAKP